MSVLAIGALEVVRFFRRRSTVWIFVAAFAVVCGVYVIGSTLPDVGLLVGGGLENLNRMLMLLQVVCLCAASQVMARQSVANEISAGSYTLLTQTPIQAGKIGLGKLLGLAVILFFGHSMVAMVVMLPTPLIRRPISVFFLFLLGGWLLAVSLIPAGLAEGMAKRTGARRWPQHVSGVMRFVGPIVVLQALILPESKAVGVNIWSVVLQFLGNVFGSESDPACSNFGGSVVPIVVIACWFVAIAVLDWTRMVGRLRLSRG